MGRLCIKRFFAARDTHTRTRIIALSAVRIIAWIGVCLLNGDGPEGLDGPSLSELMGLQLNINVCHTKLSHISCQHVNPCKV